MEDYKFKYLKYKAKYLSLLRKANIDTEQGGGSGNSKLKMFLFKAEWCGHCVRFKDTWDELESHYHNNSNIEFVKYDSDMNPDMINKYNVMGFPTLMLMNGNDKLNYSGPRDIDSLKRFINGQLNN